MPELLIKKWWMITLRGMLAIIFGILTLIWPAITLLVLVLLFGVYVLVDSLFAIATGFSYRNRNKQWWAIVLSGIFGIAIGLVTFFWPEITALALLMLIAVWAFLKGVLEIATAIKLRRILSGEWLMALTGSLSILFAFLLVVFPGTGALALVWLIGAYSIVSGIILLILSFRLSSIGKNKTRRLACYH